MRELVIGDKIHSWVAQQDCDDDDNERRCPPGSVGVVESKDFIKDRGVWNYGVVFEGPKGTPGPWVFLDDDELLNHIHYALANDYQLHPTRPINRLDQPETPVFTVRGTTGRLIAQFADYAWVLWDNEQIPTTMDRVAVLTSVLAHNSPF